jgi:hypothetical protein
VTADWEAVLRAAAELQALVDGSVLVGGTAAAVHVAHRRSFDADHLVADLGQRFGQLLAMLEQRDDWITARALPEKLSLGSFRGVETGLRQLRRARPLDTTVVATPGGPVTVPTKVEMIRIKGWLVVQRNATRDFVDLAALTASAGAADTKHAFASFDRCYVDVYRPDAQRDVSPMLQLARQLAAPLPHDLADTDVTHYKGIVAPWTSWDRIASQCGTVAVWIGELLADGGTEPPDATPVSRTPP